MGRGRQAACLKIHAICTAYALEIQCTYAPSHEYPSVALISIASSSRMQRAASSSGLALAAGAELPEALRATPEDIALLLSSGINCRQRFLLECLRVNNASGRLTVAQAAIWAGKIAKQARPAYAAAFSSTRGAQS